MMVLALDDDDLVFLTSANVVQFKEVGLLPSVSSTVHRILALGQPGYLSSPIAS